MLNKVKHVVQSTVQYVLYTVQYVRCANHDHSVHITSNIYLNI